MVADLQRQRLLADVTGIAASASTWSNCTRGPHDGYVGTRASCVQPVTSRGTGPGRFRSPISSRGAGNDAGPPRDRAQLRARSSLARTTGAR